MASRALSHVTPLVFPFPSVLGIFFFNAINVYSVDIIIDVIILTVQQKTLLAIKKDNHNILENRGKGKQVIELVISYLVTKHPYSHLFVTTISKLKSQRA